MSDQLPYSERYRLIKLGLLAKESGPKPKKRISPISEKKKKELKEAKDVVTGETDLQLWFRGRMKFMTGHCMWCGCKTETHVYSGAIFSICHILEKRDTMCPSVKTHPLNWVELCPDHHTMFDKMTWEEKEKLGFWDTVRVRLIMIYPDLAPDERRHFPQSVREYIEKNEPF